MISIAQPNIAEFPRVLTVAQMAMRLGVSTKRAYEIVPMLPAGCVCRYGKQIRILEAALKTWLENGGTAATNGNSSSKEEWPGSS